MSPTKTWTSVEVRAALVNDLARQGLKPAKGATVMLAITPGDRPGECATVSASVEVEPSSDPDAHR